jgi:hypothetical protein
MSVVFSSLCLLSCVYSILCCACVEPSSSYSSSPIHLRHCTRFRHPLQVMALLSAYHPSLVLNLCCCPAKYRASSPSLFNFECSSSSQYFRTLQFSNSVDCLKLHESIVPVPRVLSTSASRFVSLNFASSLFQSSLYFRNFVFGLDTKVSLAPIFQLAAVL